MFSRLKFSQTENVMLFSKRTPMCPQLSSLAPWRPKCELEQAAREAHHNWKLAEAWAAGGGGRAGGGGSSCQWARMDLSGQDVAAVSLAVRKARYGGVHVLALGRGC